MKTTISQSVETCTITNWKCDCCGQIFDRHSIARSHAMLIHDVPVVECESPFGPIAFLKNEEQANAWINVQNDCTIDWHDTGWYAPEVTGDEGTRYRMIGDVLANVERRLTDLGEYAASLHAVSGTNPK